MKILIGLSGGLDSTYAAHILKEQGHDVHGCAVIMHEYTDISSAREAAEAVGIPFTVIDARQAFESRVVERFISDYKNGKTPNPCIECNPAIKFGALCEYAYKNGFDKVSTGHYAKIDNADGRYFIKSDTASGKDQSYVLWKLTQKQLSMLYLPLCGMNKDEIRLSAASLGYKAAEAKDSQDICFIPDGDYVGFIKSRTGKEFPEGDFVDADGKVIGRHKGIISYTVGQRKGLGAFGKPMFVSKVDPSNNTVTLVPAGEEFSGKTEIGELNFMKLSPMTEGKIKASCRVRYSAKPSPCTVTFEGENAIVEFENMTRAVTPGQSAVFYDGDDLLFGGIIK